MKNKKKIQSKNRRGFYFTLDALFAMVILFIVISIIPFTYKSELYPHYRTSYIQEDAQGIFSSVKTSEINTLEINFILNKSEYNDTLDSTDVLIETVSKLWATNHKEDARNITEEVLSRVLEEEDSFGLFFNNGTDLEEIYTNGEIDYEKAGDIVSSEQIISGVAEGQELKGYSARVFLQKKEKTKMIYFGGYIGEGNISQVFELSNVTNITNVSIELAINARFDLYLNNVFLRNYNFASQYPYLTPIVIYLPANDFENLINGTNFIEFKNSSEKLSISGGYIKIIYKTETPEYFAAKKQHLPGTYGAINLYDSIYSSDTITSMNVKLHYSINVSEFQNTTLFFKIGNTTIYSNTSMGPVSEYTANIDNPTILSLITNYEPISNKTVPIRIGFEEFGEGLESGNADVVLITDLSDSMTWMLINESDGVTRNCDDSLLESNTTKRISLAKCLDKEFIDILLAVKGNRVALSAFYGDDSPPYKGRVYQENLTNNSDYLKGKIENYSPQGGTCICCAINDAYKILNEQSNWTKKKYVVVMSDGIPTHTCAAANKCDGTRTGLPSEEGLWLGSAGCYGGIDDCSTADCECGSQNANWSSCRTHNDLNAKVYSIGFGPVASCYMANKTLKNIAVCGNGNYYASSDASELKEIYRNISEEIVGLSYTEQKINITGSFSSNLYNDSYIEYEYNTTNPKFGNLITFEVNDFNSSSQTKFNFSEGYPLEVVATSYSGPKWTKLVKIDNQTNQGFSTAYNLGNYGIEYSVLGDPFRINIPLKFVGKNNVVELKITNLTNESDASSSDKIIYTLLVSSNYSYSNITRAAEGCNWNVQYSIEGQTSYETILVPENYSGANRCYYNDSSGNCVGSAENILQEDAIAQATYLLLKDYIDKNPKDCKLDMKISDYKINSILLPSIPFLYYTTIEFLSWR